MRDVKEEIKAIYVQHTFSGQREADCDRPFVKHALRHVEEGARSDLSG